MTHPTAVVTVTNPPVRRSDVWSCSPTHHSNNNNAASNGTIAGGAGGDVLCQGLGAAQMQHKTPTKKNSTAKVFGELNVAGEPFAIDAAAATVRACGKVLQVGKVRAPRNGGGESRGVAGTRAATARAAPVATLVSNGNGR